MIGPIPRIPYTLDPARILAEDGASGDGWAERGMWASLLWKEQELEGKVLLRAVKRSDGGKAKEGSNFLNSLYPKSCKNS